MTLKEYFLTFKAAARLLFECSPRIVWKFMRNFGLRSLINISRFEKRQRKGKPFFPAIHQYCQCFGLRIYFSAIIAKLKITSAFFAFITLTVTNITAFYEATAATFFTSYILHNIFLQRQ